MTKIRICIIRIELKIKYKDANSTIKAAMYQSTSQNTIMFIFILNYKNSPREVLSLFCQTVDMRNRNQFTERLFHKKSTSTIYAL